MNGANSMADGPWLTVSSAYSYDCHGCGRCCYHKLIRVNPYESLRLARQLGISTTEFLARFVDEQQCLRRTASGACVFLDGLVCGVHADRPAACRIYPLAMVERLDGEPMFAQLRGHPDSAGITGSAGTVQDYIDAQKLAEFDEPYRAYREIFHRLVELLARGPRTTADAEEISWLDVDSGLGAGAPQNVSAAYRAHVQYLLAALDRLESQVEPDGMGDGRR